MADKGSISIIGAKENNLKDISLNIPRNKFVVITGISGSGKSSLAFDTLFAEGQRRFAESLSSYARQFLGRMSKPDVASITGIPPAIAIEQKVNVKNPRSTVSTTTELYDYIRLVFSRIGRTYSPISGQEVKVDNTKDVIDYISTLKVDSFLLLADLNWELRTDKVEALLSLKEEGYSRFWTDKLERIDDILARANNLPPKLYLVLDRVRPIYFEDGKAYNLLKEELTSQEVEDYNNRLFESIESCFSLGNGRMYVLADNELKEFSTRFEADGITFSKPSDYLFSFNSPLGACPVCGGLGSIIGISEDLVIPDKTLSIYDGAIACWRGDKMNNLKDKLIMSAEKYNIPIFKPYCQLDTKSKDIIWNGAKDVDGNEDIVGINEFFNWVESKKYKVQYRYLLSRFSGRTVCWSCKGSRLRKEALYVKVGGKNIHEVLSMNVSEAKSFFLNLTLNQYEKNIVDKTLKEILFRLQCIEDVGLSYLTLNRASNTLSGGETQRINLVTALGTSLVGSMYILDEPSIGLHPRDTERLISVIKQLRDLGNTIIVVEHDEVIMKEADLLIDMGKYAGINGGNVVYKGNLREALSSKEIKNSLTLQYLTHQIKPYKRVKRTWNKSIIIRGAYQNNLKGIDVEFPLGVLTVVTGVSGSGKSSLVGDILYPAINRHINQIGELPGIFKKLEGDLNLISNVEYIDQNPIGRSSRSNAVTYLKIYDDIRKLMSNQQYAKINGYTPSFFSFNQEGGRCTECQGEGYVKIGMQFMADVKMVCEACGGKRFKPDILEVKYYDKNIDDILNMSVSEAIEFFEDKPEDEARRISHKLKYLVDVGLDYIKLGQSSSTLSGGESQRIKLAYFLSLNESTNKNILFIFDEPTTGLHFYDIDKLLKSFDALLKNGHSIIVVEHNVSVIEQADWVIDLGPEAGDNGGNLVYAGKVEEMIKCDKSLTAKYLFENK